MEWISSLFFAEKDIELPEEKDNMQELETSKKSPKKMPKNISLRN